MTRQRCLEGDDVKLSTGIVIADKGGFLVELSDSPVACDEKDRAIALAFDLMGGVNKHDVVPGHRS